MPALPFSQALLANQRGFNPLIGWQYEYVPAAYQSGAVLKLLVRATNNNVQLSVASGSTSIQERSPVQGGGTAGVTPTDFTTSPVTWVAMPGDRLKLVLDEIAATTPTVDGIVIIEPL